MIREVMYLPLSLQRSLAEWACAMYIICWKDAPGNRPHITPLSNRQITVRQTDERIEWGAPNGTVY